MVTPPTTRPEIAPSHTALSWRASSAGVQPVPPGKQLALVLAEVTTAS